MVLFLTTPVGVGHVNGFVKRFDRAWGRDLVEMTYAELFRRGSAPTGCAYLFTDRERMSEPSRAIACELWERLEGCGQPVRLLNDPRKQLNRHDLLLKLYHSGVNDFRPFRLAELADAKPRFPVFLRIEDDHSGPKSELITDASQLELEFRKLLLGGIPEEKIIAIEFSEVAEADGMRRKFGAVRIGDEVICQHILFSRDWNVKAEGSIREPANLEESDEYFRTNPHAERLMPIFETAGIEFGRIDYSLCGNSIRVWEINDNPRIATGRYRRLSNVRKGPRFYEAFMKLTEGLEQGRPISIADEILVAAG